MNKPKRASWNHSRAFIFSGEGIAVGVFKQTAGTHNYGGLSEIVEHLHELIYDVCREFPVEQFLLHLIGFFEHAVAWVHLDLPALPPAVVFYDIGVKQIRPDEERVVRFQFLFSFAVAFNKYRLGKEHADGFSAYQTGADHSF